MITTLCESTIVIGNVNVSSLSTIAGQNCKCLVKNIVDHIVIEKELGPDAPLGKCRAHGVG